jgi:hypothetical protein
MLIFGKCFRACAPIFIAMSVVFVYFGVAKAQTLPIQLVDQYRSCVGVEFSEIDGDPAFDDDRLRALPAPQQMDLDLGIAAGNCLKNATGMLWAFDPERNQFSTGTRYQQALNAQNLALQSRQSAQAEERVAEIERAERERRAAVWSATIDACKALYRDDVVAALTNQICQPLFLEVGLPSDGQ